PGVLLMCGIVVLLLKKPALREKLGELMTPMLIGMTSRGPDSAGVAIFGEPVKKGSHKLSLFWSKGTPEWKRLTRDAASAFPGKTRLTNTGRHAILLTEGLPDVVKR